MNEKGKPGFEVVNPILIENENFLINRGWIPFDKKDLPEINQINQNEILGTLMLQSKSSMFKPQNEIKKIIGSPLIEMTFLIRLEENFLIILFI